MHALVCGVRALQTTVETCVGPTHPLKVVFTADDDDDDGGDGGADNANGGEVRRQRRRRRLQGESSARGGGVVVTGSMPILQALTLTSPGEFVRGCDVVFSSSLFLCFSPDRCPSCKRSH
jgi:hypothetical protein